MVFGVGGVGLNVVQFAALAGANPVVAVDLVDTKLDMAQRARRHPRDQFGEGRRRRRGDQRDRRRQAAPTR